jgi:hypothetical protein
MIGQTCARTSLVELIVSALLPHYPLMARWRGRLGKSGRLALILLILNELRGLAVAAAVVMWLY